MNPQVQAQRVVEQLRLAVGSGILPTAARESGSRLLFRLSAPVRLALLGPRGGGKARVRDILAGRSVLPPEARSASVELVFGSRERCRLVFSDGTTQQFDSAPPQTTDWPNVALVRQQAPLPVLERISLLHVVADDPQDDLVAATKWAVQRCDMLLWCTTDFGPSESAAWAEVPDRLKDHTFLVPRLPRGALFPDSVRDEVVGLLPLHAEPGPDDGADDLRTAVLGHVDRGRREDFDGALMFMERFKSVLPGADRLPAARAIRDLAAIDVPEVAPATPGISPASGTAPGAVPGETCTGAPEDKGTTRVGAAQPPQAPDDAGGAQLSPAFEMLRDAAQGIGSRIEVGNPDWPSSVLAQCVETIEALPPTPPDADPELSDLVAEAWDLMMLLQLEADASAAADAVALLLQVRRAVERRLIPA